jgi:hypothetical protein
LRTLTEVARILNKTPELRFSVPGSDFEMDLKRENNGPEMRFLEKKPVVGDLKRGPQRENPSLWS